MRLPYPRVVINSPPEDGGYVIGHEVFLGTNGNITLVQAREGENSPIRGVMIPAMDTAHSDETVLANVMVTFVSEGLDEVRKALGRNVFEEKATITNAQHAQPEPLHQPNGAYL